MRRAFLTAATVAPVILPAIGDAFMGGYYAGIIDTTVGNIIATDASQTGLRFALIVAPKSMEVALLQYKTSNTAAPAAARTRWDGLTATTAMATTDYPAANHCNGLTYPSDGGSPWYLAAMDEFELIYRNLKPTTEANRTATTSSAAGTFPYDGATVTPGYDPSSDPPGPAHTSGSPAQTTVTLFTTSAERLDLSGGYYWVATEYSTTSAWRQYTSGSLAGSATSLSKSNVTRVRPVRRVLL